MLPRDRTAHYGIVQVAGMQPLFGSIRTFTMRHPGSYSLAFTPLRRGLGRLPQSSTDRAGLVECAIIRTSRALGNSPRWPGNLRSLPPPTSYAAPCSGVMLIQAEIRMLPADLLEYGVSDPAADVFPKQCASCLVTAAPDYMCPGAERTLHVDSQPSQDGRVTALSVIEKQMLVRQVIVAQRAAFGAV